MAPGGRPDDYELGDVAFSRRGALFDRQLADLRRFWNGETAVGPAPVRPVVLIGGTSDAAYRRVGEFGDGWTSGGGGVERFAEGRERARSAWRDAGREGEPRTMALIYFSLGEGGAEAARATLGAYYSFAGPYADRIVESAATEPAQLREYVDGFAGAGCNELICFPCSTDPEQVELLARAVA
jgi:alkanesulfonate monooxygenase SsuD/methylene tetrahydromethanopterin reductase-like flavin-dependent oxidoreductase (luciferase family)